MKPVASHATGHPSATGVATGLDGSRRVTLATGAQTPLTRGAQTRREVRDGSRRGQTRRCLLLSIGGSTTTGRMNETKQPSSDEAKEKK